MKSFFYRRAHFASCLALGLSLGASEHSHATTIAGNLPANTALSQLSTPTAAGETEQAPPALNITFINPGNTPFWICADQFAKRVAADLGVNLENIFAKHRLMALHDMEDVIKRESKPDFLIMQFYSVITTSMLQKLDDAGIQTYVINTDAPEDERNSVGQPREKIAGWLGHMFPDDFDVGKSLANSLIEQASNNLTTKPAKLKMIGIGGAPRTTAGTLRNEGAISASNDNPHVQLQRIVFTQWLEEEGLKAATTLLRQYPDTNIIWTASDNLAAGAIKAAQNLGYQPGKDIFIGGVDCSEQGISLVKQGLLSVTMCGHFMEAGWAIVALHDYFHGKDFVDDIGLTTNPPMHTVTKSNWQKYEGLVCDSNWQHVNFKEFSKVYYPDVKQYDFTLEHVSQHNINTEAPKEEPDNKAQ